MRVGRQSCVGSGIINSHGSNQASRSAVVASKPSRRKSCEHPSCPKQPAFSYNGSGVRFCAQHRLKGMVNVRNRRCEGAYCTKEPYFGERGGKARFCATHKPTEDMVDVRHRRCEFVSCHKQPNYGYEGQRACFCSTHKLPNMVDVKHRRCAEPGCRGYSSFAFPGSKEKFCAAHRQDGMVPSGRGRGAAAAVAAATVTTSPASPNSVSSSPTLQQAAQTITPSGQEVSKRTIVSWENVGVTAKNKRDAQASGSGGGLADSQASGDNSSPKTSVDDGDEAGRDGGVRVERERRGSAGNYDHHRQSPAVEDPRTFPARVEGFGEEARGRSSEHDMELVGDSSDVRRRGCPTEFSSPADAAAISAPYVAHDRFSPQHGDARSGGAFTFAPESSLRMRATETALEEQRRSGSFDDLVNTHRLAGVYHREAEQRLMSWSSWSAPGACARRRGAGGSSSEMWPRPPLAGDVNPISFPGQSEDACPRRAESVERDGGGSSSGDETRGGYPAPRFMGGVAGGAAAAQTGSFAAGGPSGGGSGSGGGLDDNATFNKAPISRRVENNDRFGPVSAWTETALVSRRLPDMSCPTPSKGNAVASLNSHWRDEVPKLDTVLANVGPRYLSSGFCPRRKNGDGPAWPRPDVASEPIACSRIPSGGGLCAQDRVETGGETFALKPSTSRVFTLTGPQRRLVRYDEGAGRLGPTLETLEPRWRASQPSALYA